jgi:hypothetical protein
MLKAQPNNGIHPRTCHKVFATTPTRKILYVMARLILGVGQTAENHTKSSVNILSIADITASRLLQ